MNTVLAGVQKDLHQRYAGMLFVLPDKNTDPILLRANLENKTLYKTVFCYFERNSGAEINGAYVWGKYADAETVADNIKRMNYDIRTGAAWGLSGRIALFFAALIVASLPVTSFISGGENGSHRNGVTGLFLNLSFKAGIFKWINNGSGKSVSARK